MFIYKLVVHEKCGRIEQHFTTLHDAKATFGATYSKIEEKPKYTIEHIEVLERSTHL